MIILWFIISSCFRKIALSNFIPSPNDKSINLNRNLKTYSIIPSHTIAIGSFIPNNALLRLLSKPSESISSLLKKIKYKQYCRLYVINVNFIMKM